MRSATPDVVLEFGRARDGLVVVRRKTGKNLKEVSIVKVSDEILKQVDRNPLVYLEKTLPPLVSAAPADLRKITLDLDGKMTGIARKDASSPWLFDKPSDLKGRKADAGLVQTLFESAINKVPIQGWQALKPKESQLTDWGLKSPLSRATVSYVSNGKTAEKSLLIGKETPDKKAYYARQSDSDRVSPCQGRGGKTEAAPAGPDSIQLLRQHGQDAETDRQAASAQGEHAGTGTQVGDAVAGDETGRRQNQRRPRRGTGGGHRSSQGGEVRRGQGAYDLEVKAGAMVIEITLDNKEKEKLTLTVGKAEGSSFYATSNKQPGAVFLIGKGTGDVLEKVKNDLAFLVTE